MPGTTEIITATDRRRFWAKVDRQAAASCWPWLGGVKAGAGRFVCPDRQHSAHRLAYELINGKVPSSVKIRRLCGNRLCCNPGHCLSADIEERFWSKVRKGGPANCWPWKEGVDSSGYGRVALPGFATKQSHRIAYQLAKGPIPDTLLARHSCDNPPCCNPAHLLPGTHADNARDASERERFPDRRGELNNRATLADAQALAILEHHRLVTSNRTKRAPRGTIPELAQRYQVSPAVIADLVIRKTWKHLD